MGVRGKKEENKEGQKGEKKTTKKENVSLNRNYQLQKATLVGVVIFILVKKKKSPKIPS